jgi:hypothetical protein
LVTGADTNLLVSAMALVAVICLVLSGVIAIGTILNRALSGRRDRRVEVVLAAWRARFLRDHAFREAFTLRHEDAFVVLAMWSSFRSGAMEPGRYTDVRLDFVARSAGFEEFALQLARSGDDAEKIIGLRTLGLMHATRYLTIVQAAMGSPRGDVSFEAYKALVYLDPTQVQQFFNVLPQQQNWPAPRVEALIRELGPERSSEPFARSMHEADAGQIARLARYVPLVDVSTARELIPALIERDTGPEVVAALLRAYRAAARPGDRDFLLPYLRHDAPMVRLAALSALEPIAGPADRPAILQLLTDQNHWVRDRAASVLLATQRADGSEPLQDGGMTDAFARDAVTFARAEQKLRRNASSKPSQPSPLQFVRDRVRAECSV